MRRWSRVSCAQEECTKLIPDAFCFLLAAQLTRALTLVHFTSCCHSVRVPEKRHITRSTALELLKPINNEKECNQGEPFIGGIEKRNAHDVVFVDPIVQKMTPFFSILDDAPFMEVQHSQRKLTFRQGFLRFFFQGKCWPCWMHE